MTRPSNTGWLLVGLGTQLAAMVITGFALGYALDTWLGSQPIFMFIFGILGFLGGIIKAHKLLSRLS